MTLVPVNINLFCCFSELVEKIAFISNIRKKCSEKHKINI